MYGDNKVLWAEGMFLRTQHFQQFDRHVERLARDGLQALRPFAFGFTSLEIDEALLKTGVVALSKASGLLPDGTLFSLPESDDHPAPFEAPADLRESVIHLALPIRRAGSVDSSLEVNPDRNVRWLGQEIEVADSLDETTVRAPITVGKLDLRLLHDRQELAGYVTLPIARMMEKRVDGSIILDPEFIPTALTCDAAPKLRSFVSEILGLLTHRGGAIAARLSGSGGKGTAEITDFLVLMLVNRNESLLRHLGALPMLHPEELYRFLTGLAGELATFTESSTNRPPTLPEYRHVALQESYAPLMAFLRDALSAVFEQTAIPIPLEQRPFNISVAKITDRSLFTDCIFVLAAKSSIDAEKVRLNLPRRTTIGPVERIRDLVNLQLGGAPIRPLPTEPRQIPFRAGMVYFEVNTNADDWKIVERSGGVAIHVSGEVPDLTLELWAIRGRVR
ncbi:type VI secretion system baseplate subunit TssK [Phenylobacterium sp.]|uniref:type VI secretion system baseplate subunit TssK n=1 Tax=Phenylobacterium sp. TaxID=1871053 RepID=UPI00286C83B9|nr:type VI secretion system baseplate subunit TssK [Phenylobacterium sp.]